MPTFALTGVRLAGIATAVPAARTEVQPTPTVSASDLTKVTASTGVKARHIAPAEVCTSDLCLAAAERLLQSLGWDRSSVDLLVFVTQTPDYVLPATACSLHGRLDCRECGADRRRKPEKPAGGAGKIRSADQLPVFSAGEKLRSRASLRVSTAGCRFWPMCRHFTTARRQIIFSTMSPRAFPA